MVGRFIGACLLKIFSPGKVLACAARGVVTLLLISANSIRNISGYSLACEGLSERAAERFGIICVATVGDAVIPPLTHMVGDHAGLKFALAIPALSCFEILSYGLYARRPTHA